MTGLGVAGQGDDTERGLMRNRAFMALWAAQILSQAAANATTFALIVLVGEITKSNTSSSILILLAILPAVVFGIFAGVVVDRTDRKRVLVVTNALRAAAVLPLLFLGESVSAAYIVNFLVAAITVFFVPAEAATIPAIVRKRDLLVANSLFTFTFNGAFLVGFIILAPVVIALAGYDALFTVIAAMFGGAALLCLTVPSAPRGPGHIGVAVAGAAVADTRRGVGEAFEYLRDHPPVVWSLVYIALTYMLIAVAGALAPGFVREVLGLGEKQVVILVAPAGLGVVAGLSVLNAIGGRLARPRAIGIGLIVIATALVVLALERPFGGVFRDAAGPTAAFPVFVALVGVTFFVFGLSYAFVTVPSMTLLQEELHDDIRGRIFGVLNMLVSVFSFLPLLLVGPVADLYGVAPVFVGGAVACVLAWLGGRATRARGGRRRGLNASGDAEHGA
ncbi:MAG TPA: MFS transporter [Candidatus Limnocylindria bacterium]|nr:MFS transporter [Candidatus Limnocylindria bacterium]